MQILGLQIRQLLENLVSGQARSEQVEHVADTDAHSADAGAAAALLGINRDSVGDRVHDASIAARIWTTGRTCRGAGDAGSPDRRGAGTTFLRYCAGTYVGSWVIWSMALPYAVTLPSPLMTFTVTRPL